MNKIYNTIFSSLLLSSSLALVGCGSSGGDSPPPIPSYSGITSAAKVDSTNAEALGTASGEALQQAGPATGPLPTFVSIGSNQTNVTALSQLLVDFIRNHANSDLPVSFTEPGSCGGSMSYPDAPPPSTGPYSVTINFTNYCDVSIDTTMKFTGRAVFTIDDVAAPEVFTIQYINFKVTQNAETTTLNLTASCDLSPSGTGCTISSDFVSSSGTVHRMADISITGDESSGFDGTMVFYHSGYGSVTLTVTGVTFGSCGGFPDGGSIDYLGTGGSAGTVFFASDCSYSGTYDDGAGTTGGFSGSFI